MEILQKVALEDSFSQKLKGYVEVDEAVISKLDESVADLLIMLVRDLRRLK